MGMRANLLAMQSNDFSRANEDAGAIVLKDNKVGTTDSLTNLGSSARESEIVTVTTTPFEPMTRSVEIVTMG